MNNLLRNWWKIALALVAAGAVMYLASFALGASGGYAYIGDRGLRFISADEGALVREMDIAPFDTVGVTTSAADIEFVASDHYGIEMRLPEFIGEPEWGVTDGKLTVNASSDGKYLTFMDFGFLQFYVKIYFPGGDGSQHGADAETAAFKSIELSSLSGDILLPALSADSISLKTTSGNIKADVRHYKHAAAQTTSGNIAFSGSGIDASLSLSATNGDIKADASGCGNVDLGTASGKVTLTGDTSPSAELRVTAKSGDATVDVTGWTSLTSETGSGDIRITGGPSGGTTSAKTGSGNVTMALRGDERDFSYQISAGSGSVRVGGRRMGDSAQYTNSDTRNMIHANTRSGNIRVDFTQN